MQKFADNIQNGQSVLTGAARRELLERYSHNIDMPHTLSELIQWMDDHKARNHITLKRRGLASLQDWRLDTSGYFAHKENRFFRIVGLWVSSPHREVTTWSQPIVSNAGTGIIGLLIRKRNSSLDVLMQAKAEVGNRSIVQLSPTVQFTPGNYHHSTLLRKSFLFEEFLQPRQFSLVSESRQSEEGGRFYKEDHIHRILLLPESTDIDLPLSHRWLSLSQVRFFLNLGEYVNYCARSILSCLLASELLIRDRAE